MRDETAPDTSIDTATLRRALDQAAEIVIGKPHALRLALTCLVANGHLLVEDVPGVGKTTLAQTLAKVLGLSLSRVQFTSDLLPADVLGVSIYEPDQHAFRFHPGPIFAQVVLADEVNRANPKSQSALLEAMEERQVTVDGKTHALPEPFFVIATQNPTEQIGTFPLPESQLDRFLMRIDVGYPSEQAELELLAGADRRQLLKQLQASLQPEQVLAAQAAARAVKTTPPLLQYVLDLVLTTRRHAKVKDGLSPRAGLALKRAAQAWALLDGRPGVLPEDVQAVFPAVVGHRLRSASEDGGASDLAQQILQQVAVP
ncbi:AAA domain-containing protein [bacterium]|nr:AAA domain-containing protein [bacterium]